MERDVLKFAFICLLFLTFLSGCGSSDESTDSSDTMPPTLSNPVPAQSSVLPAGTAATLLSVTTSEAAMCRYSTTANTAYSAMSNNFAITGSTAHSTTVTGLTNGNAYSFYVRCQDNSGNANANDYPITFSVAAGGGGTNNPPVLGAIADIIVTEGETITFSPTATDIDADNLTFSYSGWMTSSAYTTQVGDAGTHTVTITVDDGNGGTDSQAVSVTVLAAPLDTTPPVRASGTPTGILPTGTTSATLSLVTDENATCRYATTVNTAYSSMANSFITTGSISHSTSITGLTDGNSFTYYVKCQDTSGNANTNDYLITFSIAAPSNGNAFYVAPPPAGSDANPGSLNLPFLTIAKGLSVAQTGDTVYLRAGAYTEQVNFPTAGNATGRITLKAYNGEVATITQTGRVMNIGQPYITVEDLVLDGNWGTQDILKVYDAGNYLVLRGVEVKNTLWDAVDISAPSDVLVENCKIHDAIYINNGVRVDAHGIVTAGVQNLTIRNTEIYYVSGDAIQLQYGGWDNVLVEDSDLWNGPLPTARGGANAGDNVGEDAIDTKYNIADGRGRLTVTNTVAHGWGRGGNPLYATSAGFNIKHNVEVTFDGVTTYDNNYSFRLRGPGSRGEAWVTLKNGVIYNSNVGVRYEDGINNLHIYNTTFGGNNTTIFQSAGGYGTGLEVKNNLFQAINLPVEATMVDGNMAVDSSHFIAVDDYHLVSTSQAINAGIDLSAVGVSVDRDGITRPQELLYDIGAYEYMGVASPDASISLDPTTLHQTMKGWEVGAWIDQFDTQYNIDHVNLWSAAAADIAVNTFGVNRVRLETHSGQEDTTPYFAQYISGKIPRSGWRSQAYNIINDNNDPFVINPLGFQFDKVDYAIDLVINPLKTRLEANGENLYVNLTYVAFGASGTGFNHYSNPEEYAEFILAVFQHIESKYGWVPDGVEVILEPDVASGWSGTQVGNALVAAAKRLEANGYTPDFIAPATTSMANASSYFDQLISVHEVTKYIKEIAYHRYSGVSSSNLQNIVNRANQYGLDTSMLEWWNGNNTFHTLHEDLKNGYNSSWQGGVIAKVTNPENRLTLAVVDSSNPSNPQISVNHGAKYIRQYYKFIRSGARRIGAATDNSDFDPLAFINTDGGYVVVVKAATSGDFSIQGLAAGTYGIKYTTGSSNNPPTEYDIDLPNQTIAAGQALTTFIPAAGIITIYASPTQ